MKATEQYFPVVLFIMLYNVVLNLASADEILKVTIQMKATEQYFPVVYFPVVQLNVMVLNFQCVGKVLKCHHSGGSY